MSALSAADMFLYNELVPLGDISTLDKDFNIYLLNSFTTLSVCPSNQSIAQGKRNADGFELLVRNMKDYKTSATLMELITRPPIDNLKKIPSEIAGLLRLPVNARYFFTTTRRFT